MLKKKRIGLREIAKQTGYNIGTISRALNGQPGISRENAERILKLAYDLGYRNSALKRIAVILPSMRNTLQWYSLNLINAICQTALKRSACLELIFADQVEMMLDRSVSGIISIDSSNMILHKIREVVPFVTINNFADIQDDMYSISSNMQNGIGKSLRLLNSYGHRKVGLYITGRKTLNTQSLEKAFQKDLASFDMTGEVAWKYADGKNPIYSYGGLLSLLEKNVTAVIANDETISSEILAGIRFCGKRVPKDVSLITWEVPYFSKFQDPPLTTVSQDFSKLAESAFDLLEQIAQKKNPPLTTSIDCILTERNSVACPLNQKTRSRKRA